MSGQLNERFKVVPEILQQSVEQTNDANSGTTCVGSKFSVESKPAPGTAFRITLAGTNTGGNAAHTLILYIGASAAMTLTADAVTAVDYTAQFTVIFQNPKVQKIMGVMQGNALDCENDYAAGAVDCSAGAEIKVVLTSGHGSDTATCEMVIVEKWVQELVTS